MAYRLSKFIVFFLIIFTPLAFGTVEPWSYAVMELCTGAGIFFFLICLVQKKDDLHEVPGLYVILVFLGYILFQVLPLPPMVVEWLSPRAHLIQEQAMALTGDSWWMTLSVNPKATITEFFRYGTYGAFYLLSVQILKDKDSLQAVVLAIAVFGGILAFSSILQFYMTEDMALWFRHSPDNSIIMGPYVNHNHYAGLMEMMFPIVLALFFFYRPRMGSTSFFKGIIEILAQEKANIHILIGTSALLMVVSIFVSLSRGGMISISIAMVLYFLLLIKRRISRGNTLMIIALIAAAALAISWFGWDQIFDRFAKLRNAQGIITESRLTFWEDTLEIIKDFPITGSGMGTFIHIYPSYKSLVDRFTLTHAHNDYLELLAEGGMIGFLIAAAFIFTIIKRTYPIFLKRRDGFSIYLYMGSLTAMCAILIHSMTDFNMHIGANGLWFFFVAALAVSSAHTNIRRKASPTRLKVVPAILKSALYLPGAGLFVLGLVVFNISGILGTLHFSTIQEDKISPGTDPLELKEIKKSACSVLALDPWHAEASYLKANAQWMLENPSQAHRDFSKALMLDPLNARYLKRFGLFLARQDWPQKASTAFELSTRYEPTKPEYAFQNGSWLLSKGLKEAGIQQMKRALELDGKYTDRVLTALILSGIGIDEIPKAIPDKPGPFLSFSQFLYTIGRQDQANRMYMDALDLIKQQKRVNSWYFYKVHKFFLRQGDLKNAELAMTAAEEAMPQDHGIKVTLGDLYRRQGILYKAREKYEQALFLDPGNTKIRERIHAIEKAIKATF